MTKARRIASNTAALAVSKVATLGLSFIVWVHLARTLNAEGVGVLTFGTALLAYFLLLITLGIDAVTVREIARDPGRTADLVPTVLGIRLSLLVLGGGAYLAMVLGLPRFAPDRTVLLVLGGMLVVRAVQLDWVYQGIEEMGVIAVRDVAASVLAAGAAVLFVRAPDDVVPAAMAIVAGPLLSNLSLLVGYSRRFRLAFPRFDRARWRAVLIPSIPLMASVFLSEVYYSLDKVMLEALRTTAEVGQYGVAYKVLSLAIAPAAVLYGAFYPALANAVGDADQMRAVGEAYARVQFGVGLAVAAGGVVVAPALVPAVFGPDYAVAGPALQLLLLNAGVMYVAMAYGVPLMAWDRQGDYFRAVATGAIANIGPNVLLIRPFGIEGAALATLLSEGTVLVSLAWFYRQSTEHLLSPLLVRALATGLVGAALPAAALLRLGVPVLAIVPGVAATSLVALGYSGLLTPATLRSLLHRR